MFKEKVKSNTMARQQLRRDLGFESALMLGIGTMIGAGIFILPSIAAEEAGPAASVSYLIGGLIAIFTALSISELATGMPKAGGSYYFINRSLGPFFGTITGIGMWMGLIFASAFYMIGFQYYLSNFVPFGSREMAIGVTVALIVINLRGTKGAGDFQKISVKLLLVILLIFILAGLFDVKESNLENFNPGGYPAVAGLAGILFIGFMGFEVIATMGEEIKEPEKNLWKAMMVSVIVVTVIYIVIILVAIGGVGREALASQDTPISYAAEKGVMGYPGWVLISLAALLATISSANASILSASRISFAMGKDRILHPWMKNVHSKFMTPTNSITITGIIILGFQAVGEVELLAEVASFMFLFTFFIIHFCVGVLRRTRPDWYKPSFRSPLFPVFQILGGGACILVITQMNLLSIGIGTLLIGMAVLWYFAWSRHKSRVEGEVKKIFEEKKLEDLKKVIHVEEARTRKILVPFTNMVYELMKLRMAAALATGEGAMVRLNVVTIPDQVSVEGALPYVDVESIKLLEEIKELDTKVGTMKEYKQIIAHSAPATIVKVAKEDNCQLILLGRYHTRLPTARIKETLANYVLHKANTDIGILSMNQECLARVIKRQKRAKKKSKKKIMGVKKSDSKGGKKAGDRLCPDPEELPKIKKILVPFDDNSHTQLALEFASKIGIYESAEVTLFQVCFKKDLEEKQEKMEHIMKDFSVEGFKLKPMLVTGRSPTKEIVAASGDYDLIIMGASRKWVLNKFLFGSVPDRVMAEADCPVLFAKKWEPSALSAVRGRV